MPLEARPSGLIIAPKRSGTNFVHDVLAPAYHSAVNEPLGLHNEVPGDNQNPLSPWNFSGAEHASAEFGHTALADDPFGSLVTRSFLYWLSEGNQLIKETDFLYLGWLLASAKLKVVSIYRDPRQSIASYRKHDLFHKWQFKSKLTHFFDTINTTPVLDTLYGGLSSFRSLAKTADHHQLAVYYAIAIHEIKRNTQGFDSFETSYDDLVYHSEATFQKLANYLQIPWTEQLQTAIRIRTSTTRDVGAHGTFRHSSDLSHFSQILSLPEITDIQAIFKELGISLQESQPVVVPQILGPKPDRVETPSVLVTQANREAASTAILQDAVLVDVEKPLLIASKLITNLQYSEFL